MIPEGLSLTDNTIVQVAALPFIRDADILNVEPLSIEDWDLLETRAEFLEEGALLRQVSVVYANQKLPLWVGGKDIAWVNVLLENFSSDQGNSGAWPQDNSFASEKMACLRLVANTRFCVIPKTKEESREKASPPFRVYPTTHDYAKPMIKLAESLGSMQVSTTPNTALIHPDTTAQIPGWRPEDKAGTVVLWNTSHNQDDDSIVIQIATNKNIPLQYIGKTLKRYSVCFNCWT